MSNPTAEHNHAIFPLRWCHNLDFQWGGKVQVQQTLYKSGGNLFVDLNTTQCTFHHETNVLSIGIIKDIVVGASEVNLGM